MVVVIDLYDRSIQSRLAITKLSVTLLNLFVLSESSKLLNHIKVSQHRQLSMLAENTDRALLNARDLQGMAGFDQ